MAAYDAEPAAEAHVAYMAGGCFWGLERAMQNVDGVTDTTVGYAQSNTPNPTYRQVCSGATGAVETVRVAYDPERVNLRTLTLLFLDIIDPFSVDRQGNDVGAQYRSGLYPAGERAAEQRVVYGRRWRNSRNVPATNRLWKWSSCATSHLRSPSIRIIYSSIRVVIAIFRWM